MRLEDVLSEEAQVRIKEYFVDGKMKTGVIEMRGQSYPIVNGIPRFVETEEYTSNFGLQWNEFKLTQYDSHTGLSLTQDRLWKNTRWKPEDLKGKTVLEIGSGAGRFTEIFLAAGANVVSFDLSNAVEANFAANSKKGNLILVQASVYDMPFKENFFDFVFCYGVLQHTPDPQLAFKKIVNMARKNGRISIDYYRKFWRPTPFSTPKYFWRPLTTHLSPELLLRILRFYIPKWLPIDTFLQSIPKLGSTLSALTLVPCWNYRTLPLKENEKLEWAIMDTFDALGAKYDKPLTKEGMRKFVQVDNFATSEIFFGSNGIVANGTRR